MQFPGSPRHLISRPPKSRPAHCCAVDCHGETTDIPIGIPKNPRPTRGQPLDIHPGEVAGIKNPCVGGTPGHNLGGRKIGSITGNGIANREIDIHFKIPCP